MLSRLSARTSSIAARALNTRVLAAAPKLDKFEARGFKSAPTLRSTMELGTKPAENPAEIIDKYGATTFWGMLAAIVVSKELFILDAEFLLSIEIGAFVMAGYVMTGDTLNKMSEDIDKASIEKFNGANDFMIEMFNQYKMVQSTVQNKPEVLQQYAVEYKQAIEAHAAYETVKPKHAARAQVLAALEQIKNQEADAAALEWQSTVDTAVANVTKAFQAGDAKLNDEALLLAINGLGFTAPETTESNDPVKRLFMKEFTE